MCLNDLWRYDVAKERWIKLAGEENHTSGLIGSEEAIQRAKMQLDLEGEIKPEDAQAISAKQMNERIKQNRNKGTSTEFA